MISFELEEAVGCSATRAFFAVEGRPEFGGIEALGVSPLFRLLLPPPSFSKSQIRRMKLFTTFALVGLPLLVAKSQGFSLSGMNDEIAFL